jgi:hypothetical protein
MDETFGTYAWNFNSNPAKWDTDGDGLSDSEDLYPLVSNDTTNNVLFESITVTPNEGNVGEIYGVEGTVFNNSGLSIEDIVLSFKVNDEWFSYSDITTNSVYSEKLLWR